MKITVIIPARNLSYGIVKCLDSINMQDFSKSEYEILIVLDSCTDNTETVVSEWRATHPDVNVRTFSTQCGCPGGARNVGLDNATGDYIMFIDGDDWLINNSAMTILHAAAQGHNAVRVMDHEVTPQMVKFSERLTIWLHFFSRELIGEDRFTDLLLCEDYEFVKRIRNKPGYDEGIVTTPLYYYNYDRERMQARIRNVLALSKEREAQGLPPLYVCDEFIPEGAKIALEKCRNA